MSSKYEHVIGLGLKPVTDWMLLVFDASGLIIQSSTSHEQISTKHDKTPFTIGKHFAKEGISFPFHIELLQSYMKSIIHEVPIKVMEIQKLLK